MAIYNSSDYYKLQQRVITIYRTGANNAKCGKRYYSLHLVSQNAKIVRSDYYKLRQRVIRINDRWVITKRDATGQCSCNQPSRLLNL